MQMTRQINDDDDGDDSRQVTERTHIWASENHECRTITQSIGYKGNTVTWMYAD